MIRATGGLPYGSRGISVPDEFPLLDFKELSLCLQECDFVANEDLVSRPTGAYIRSLLEQILDTFMGFSAEYTVSTTHSLLRQHASVGGLPASAGDALYKEEDSYDTANSVQLLVLFRAATVMLRKCGIHDFTLMDLVRPEAPRIRRILSGVINFARFREEHLRECEALARESEDKMQEVRNLDERNVDLANKIDRLNDRLLTGSGDGSDHNTKSTLLQLNNYNTKLEQELRKLQKQQESLKQDHNLYKESKSRLYDKLEDHHFILGEYSTELEKLKSYAETDLDVVKKNIDDLKEHLQSHEEYLNTYKGNLTNKTRTVEAIQQIEDELRNLIKIAQEIVSDVKKAELASENLQKQIEEYGSKKVTSDELAVHIQRVKRQLLKSEEKLTKLRQQAQEREENAKERLRLLEAEYDRLAKDRELKQETLDQTKAENTEIELQIGAMRLDFDTEFRNTEIAVAKLNSHILQYLLTIGGHL